MATKKRYICLSRMPSAKKISVKILSEKGILRRRIKGEEIGVWMECRNQKLANAKRKKCGDSGIVCRIGPEFFPRLFGNFAPDGAD